MTAASLHLSVALDGAGWHPAAWREPDARPAELTSPGYWVDLARRADGGGIDFITIEDSLRLQSGRYDGADGRTDRVRGRLDATLIAARVAPLTRHVGLVPSVTVTHTEPFHLSKAIATLDYVSGGRAGVRVQISGRAEEAALFGRREVPADLLADRTSPAAQAFLADLFDEAADYVEVVRRLWDSWEDDAEIRDAASGRFVDREKLHYVDFEGRWFSVKGPSITPRPPQGQPLVTALAHATLPYRLAARQADVVFVTPGDATGARAIVEQIRAEQELAGRGGETLHVFADLLVLLDDTEAAATARLVRLDATAGRPLKSDAHVFTGTPAGLADLLVEWAAAGLSGFRLRPAALPHDLDAVVDGLVPELERRGLTAAAQTAAAQTAPSLRTRLGLDRPANRYAA
jgi:alkanesulfonate monooxygenase SsuD/methylene tetrahydromethanopterin reductase-like flavin-dependent oxidoreductase (luciferase family)